MYSSVSTKDTLPDSIREDIEDGDSDVDTGKCIHIFDKLKWIELVRLNGHNLLDLTTNSRNRLTSDQNIDYANVVILNSCVYL